VIANLPEVVLSTICFVFVGGLATAFISAAAALPLVLASPLLGFRRTVELIARIFLFIAVLHGVSLVANGVFVGAFRNHLYYAADPVIDFLPYLPFSDFATDPACGGHLLGGASESTFFLAWMLFAVPVWIGSILIFKKATAPEVARRLTRRTS
jgi:hypothetical protein